MFSNVKAAICVGDLVFDRASSLDFSPSGFSSISPCSHPFTVKVGSVKVDAKLK